ncbi:hypothetical protein [Chryseobacterium lineare]
MKNKTVRLFAIAVMSIACTGSVFGQRHTSPPQRAENENGAQSRIPNLVSQNFVNEYPKVTDAVWRGYPQQSFITEWYDDNPSAQSSQPAEYYTARFTSGKSHLKAIYTKDGEKISVRQMITSELPKPVLYAITNGDYSDWKIANEKEVIFKNNPRDAMKVYKIKVEKGPSKHDLFYSSEGVLLKDKTIR